MKGSEEQNFQMCVLKQPCEKWVKKSRFGSGQETGYGLVTTHTWYSQSYIAIAKTVTSTGHVPGTCVLCPPLHAVLCLETFAQDDLGALSEGCKASGGATPACPAAASPWVGGVEFNFVVVVELLQLLMSQIIAINKTRGVGKGNIFY